MAETDSGDTSERYEFDAPSQVVDLKELENNADSEDMWFGKYSNELSDWYLVNVEIILNISCLFSCVVFLQLCICFTVRWMCLEENIC